MPMTSFKQWFEEDVVDGYDGSDYNSYFKEKAKERLDDYEPLKGWKFRRDVKDVFLRTSAEAITGTKKDLTDWVGEKGSTSKSGGRDIEKIYNMGITYSTKQGSSQAAIEIHKDGDKYLVTTARTRNPGTRQGYIRAVFQLNNGVSKDQMVELAEDFCGNGYRFTPVQSSVKYGKVEEIAKDLYQDAGAGFMAGITKLFKKGTTLKVGGYKAVSKGKGKTPEIYKSRL